MKSTKKIWYDENSEPPKNYLWAKGGKLFKYVDGQWKEVSENDAGCGCSDIQIVELTYDHLPATGTLSASDLEKLDGDNCLLVMKGKYFRKTYGSDGGIDYKEIGISTVSGGLRSIYFTASKPDGEYTIAYTYPIEANTQTQAMAALENIKVGNTTYSVPLAPLMIAGTWAEENNYQFTPDEGEPTIDDAVVAFKAGRTVVLHITADYELNDQPAVANYYSPLLAYEEAGAAPHFTYRADGEYMEWYVPSGDDGPDDLNPHPVI